MEKNLQNAINWLVNSQYNKGKVKGFIPKYTSMFRKLYVYPEITGYAISTFSMLYKVTKNEIYLEKAMLAADGVLGFMQDSGAIPSIISKDGNYEDVCYSFDQGIMTRGLLDLYEVMLENNIKDSQVYKKAGLKGIDFILNNSSKGVIADRYFLDGKIKNDFNYCIMLKCCRAYASAYRITNDQKYLDEIIKVSNYYIDKFQFKSGVFKLVDKHERNRIHYHCYAIEALIEILKVYNNEKVFNSALLGADYLLKAQKENGGFNNRVIEDEYNSQEDIPPVAQAIAIWNYFYKINKDLRYQNAIEKAQKYLNERQYSSFGKLNGGLPFMLPQKHKIACSWAVLFYIDSMLQLDKENLI